MKGRWIAWAGALLLSISVAATGFAKSAFLVKEGMRGDNVRQVQELLIAQGFLSGKADGICGAKTVEAIKRFQREAGLKADGICGDETYARMRAGEDISSAKTKGAVKPGMRGDRVRAMQELLVKHGYLHAEPDGVFGKMTEEALRGFQRDQGLTVDGICGRTTLAYLEGRQSGSPNAYTGVKPKEQSAYAAVGSVIKPGMHGDGVILVQEYLIDLGYLSGEADGIYGPGSVAAMKKFQRENGLNPDGICGRATYAALQVSPQVMDGPTPQKHGTDDGAPPSGRPVRVHATAYSAMESGMSLHTATGKFVQRGIIAVDPSFIPLGTRVYIPGYGEATADDTGGSIKGNRIDIAFDTTQEALDFGRREITIYILE